MRFYAHSLARPKRVAKALRKELASVSIAASLPACQDAVAEMYGYAHWREMAADIGRHTPSVEDAAIDAATVAASRSRHIEALVRRFSGFSGRRSLAEKIVDAITPTGSFVDSTHSTMIRAECHLSDYSSVAKFDALPWFEQASDEDILDWIDDQLAGFSYKGLEIAWNVRKLIGYEPLLAYEDHAEEIARASLRFRRQPIMSDVKVHIPDASRWLREHRPEVFAAAMSVAKEHKTNLEADYVPPWEGDVRWPGDYCCLSTEARQTRDKVIKTFVRPVAVPHEVKGFLNNEWLKGVMQMAVVRDGDRWLVVREWYGKREVAELEKQDISAIERMSRSKEVHFQSDISLTSLSGDRRAVADITTGADGTIRVDFSRGLVRPQTLENLGITDCASIDRVLVRRNGLIIVAGPTGSGKTATLLSLVRRWQTALQPARPSAKTMALLADPTYRGPLPVEGQIVYVGEMRDQKTLEDAVSFAASAPVVAVVHAGSVSKALQWLLDLGDGNPASLSRVLAGIISVNLSRYDDSEFDKHLLRSAGMQPRQRKMRSVAAMFATPEEAATFVAQYFPVEDAAYRR